MKLLIVAVIVNIFALGNTQDTVCISNSTEPENVEELKQLGLKGRIIGGVPASNGQFPWQALIKIKTWKGTYHCGGALISDEWVLTAAHCVKGATLFTVRLGSIYSWDEYDDSLQTITSSFSIHHEKYDPVNFNNDIGLIKLSSKADINPYVWPIELDSKATDAGTNLTISGFGRGHHTIDSYNQRLHHATVLSITNEKCQEIYEGSSVINTVICTIGKTVEGPCQGDDGGPLISFAHGAPRHVGVFSFLSCIGCDNGLPTGYTRTASFRTWIKNKSGV